MMFKRTPILRRLAGRQSRHGGTFFTMFLFLLLLLSTSLMYYFFQRTQRQDTELALWRSGKTPTAAQIEGATHSTFGGVGNLFRSLPASKILETASEGAAGFLSEDENSDPPLAEAPNVGEAVDETSAPARKALRPAAAAEAPVAEVPPTAVVQVPKSPYAPGVEERRVAERGPQPPRVSESAAKPARTPEPAAARERPSARQTPSTKTRVPAASRNADAATREPKRGTTPGNADEIGAMLRGTSDGR